MYKRQPPSVFSFPISSKKTCLFILFCLRFVLSLQYQMCIRDTVNTLQTNIIKQFLKILSLYSPSYHEPGMNCKGGKKDVYKRQLPTLPRKKQVTENSEANSCLMQFIRWNKSWMPHQKMCRKNFTQWVIHLKKKLSPIVSSQLQSIFFFSLVAWLYPL